MGETEIIPWNREILQYFAIAHYPLYENAPRTMIITYIYIKLGEKHTIYVSWHFSSKFPLMNYLRKCSHEGNLFDYGFYSEDFIQSTAN